MKKLKVSKVISFILVLAMTAILFSCARPYGSGESKADPNKHYTICISESSESAENDAMRRGLIAGLKDAGLVEDVNVTFHYANAKGIFDFAKQIAEAFADKKADVFVTIGDISTTAMSEKYKDTPIVFLGVENAIKLGYCDNDAVPTANLTGVIDSHLIEEELDFIKLEYPNVKRLGIIYDKNNALAQFDVDYYKFYATNYGIDIYTVTITKAEDIDRALDNILPKVDAINLISDYMVDDSVQKVISRTTNNGKIIFGTTEEHKAAGATVSTLRDYKLVGEKGADLVKEILINKKKVKDVKVEYIDFKVN